MVSNPLLSPFFPNPNKTDLDRQTQGLAQNKPQPSADEKAIAHNEQTLPVDSYQHIPVPSPEAPAEQAEKEQGAQSSVQGDGLNISFQFDLFYQLSQKVSAKMGQKGQEQFFELSQTVAETFQASFSLSIEPVGSFLNSTNKSLDLDPSVTQEFFDAVEGLAELTPEGLEGFLREAEDLFNSLEESFGEAGGAFDDIKEQIKAQAQMFFQQVDAIKSPEPEAAPPELPEAAAQAVPQLPAETGQPTTAADPASTPATETPLKDPFQDFLQEFLDYVKKYRGSLLLEATTTQQSSVRMYASNKQNWLEPPTTFNSEA